MGNIVMFCILAVVIVGSALLCVTTTKIMRAATFMLFVLFGVAGIYFLLDYTFLGAAQISVYAGGVTMIYVFAIQLVSKRTLQGLEERVKSSKMIVGALAAFAAGVGQCRGADEGDRNRPRWFREVSVCIAFRVHLSIPAGLYHRRLSSSKKGG